MTKSRGGCLNAKTLCNALKEPRIFGKCNHGKRESDIRLRPGNKVAESRIARSGNILSKKGLNEQIQSEGHAHRFHQRQGDGPLRIRIREVDSE